ncbi:MAG: addiction module antitoxin [Rhodoferax sp.]|nr:addiction module antitoxin [Rhodoferax sp.]
MQRRMTITMDEAVYDGLMRVVGRGKVSQFLEALARPHVLDTSLDEGYGAMSRDRDREQEATEWVNGLTADVANATR